MKTVAASMASNEFPRNDDESSPPSAASSEFVNCPQCQLELNSPQVRVKR